AAGSWWRVHGALQEPVRRGRIGLGPLQPSAWETRRAFMPGAATRAGGCLALAPLLPQHHRGGARHVHDLAAAAPSRFAAARIGELLAQHRVLLLHGLQPFLQLDDALDTREVHALL